MNIGQILGWIISNTGIISSVIQAIETIATQLQNLHGNTSIDAYAKAILAAIEAFFQGIGANTVPTPAEAATIAGPASTMGAVAAAPGLSPLAAPPASQPPSEGVG